ncbi:Structural maintenance of chromosomes protein 6 [Agyrium rufum]|nr:Structural maintenance of chromosomes protein 6 [Agyrium rufum]
MTDEQIHTLARIADNGIIESIICQNFMCHSFLEVTLGPLINFIVGHNGSGKSAVLTALMLCLGGKASTTNRAGNLKGFIKEKEESCTLSVRIKNAEPNAYMHDLYGNSIVVERHFSRQGTSGFKIRSITGKVMSTRKSDLEEICDYFALQLDNPLSVLTQDNARQFLNSSDPEIKYKFFAKGTQLETLSQDYQLVEENIEVLDTNLSAHRQDLVKLRDEVKGKKELHLLSQKQDGLREVIRKLRFEMAWSQVEEQERERDGYQNASQSVSQAMEAKRGEIDSAGQDLDMADGELNKVQETMARIQSEGESMMMEKSAVKEEFENAKREAMKAQAEQRVCGQKLRAVKDSIEKTNQAIEDETKRLEEASGGSRVARLAELEESKKEVDSAKDRYEEQLQAVRASEDRREEASQALKDSMILTQQKEEEIRRCEQRVGELRLTKGQRQQGYPSTLYSLIKAIKQESGFLQQPIGPFGEYIRLKKPAWSSVLEKSFGSALNSFLVTSKQDQHRLSQLMKRMKCAFPIIIGNSVSFDYSKHEPEESFVTSLRALEIQEPAITRQMVINQGIEQTILIEDISEARDLMNRGRLRNVRQCFSLNDRAAAGAGVRLTYAHGDLLSSSAIEPFQGNPRMKTDIEQQIERQEDVIQQLSEELRGLHARYREIQKALEQCNQEVTRQKRIARQLETIKGDTQKKTDDLQDLIDGSALEEGRMAALKAGFAELEEERVLHENFYQEAVTSRDKLNVRLGGIKQRLTALDEQAAEVEFRLKKSKVGVARETEMRFHRLTLKNSLHGELDTLENKKLGFDAKCKQRADIVSEYQKQAGQISPRVPIPEGETSDSLEAKQRKLKNDLGKMEQRLGGDKAKIAEDYQRAVAAFTRAKIEMEQEEQTLQLLKSTLYMRQQRWKMFQRHITARARAQFQGLLRQRGFRGNLKVDHKSRRMDIDIQPDESQASSKGRKTATLSGGEKSFSTICLLLSLWEAMGPPIRCLDEFDVFMDSVNRDISMKLMIAAAQNSVGRQFLLITPQSMNSINSDNNVKIIRLTDPERGQTTLGFGSTS